MLCVKHNQLFHVGGSCEVCLKSSVIPPLVKSTNPQLSHPLTPLMETKKSKKSGVLTDSYGKGYIHTEKVIISKPMVINLFESGYNQSQIAMKLGVSQPYVCKILKLLKKGEKKQRFHDFSLKFKAEFDFARLPFKTIILNKFSMYKYFAEKDFKIQLFNNGTIIVRYTVDIFHNNVVKTIDEAIAIITKYLEAWNKYDIKFINYSVSSGHNAFLNNDIAKDCIKKGEIIKYKDITDNKVRTTVDMSKGVPEFEHEHNKHFTKDSQKWEKIIHDVATDNYYNFSDTKSILDITLSVQKDYAENIKKHLLVQDKTVMALDGINKGITELREAVVELRNKEVQQEKKLKISRWIEENDLK